MGRTFGENSYKKFTLHYNNNSIWTPYLIHETTEVKDEFCEHLYLITDNSRGIIYIERGQKESVITLLYTIFTPKVKVFNYCLLK